MTAKGGPKTVKGKLISSQNSLKHGLTSSLLSDSEQAKHQMLQKAFFEEHLPKTITEELLVSDLAMIRVRLERFDEVEISLFKRAAFDAQLARNIVKDMQLNDEDIERQLYRAIQTKSGFITEEQKEIVEELRHVKVKNLNIDGTEAINRIPITIKYLKDECEALNFIANSTIARAKRIYEEGETYLPPIQIVAHDSREEAKPDINKSISELSASQLKEYIQALKAKWNKSITLQALYDEALNRLGNVENAVLPDQASLDRLYRYRTTLEKQFSSKLSQLIQLQDMRERKARIASRG